MKEQNMTTKHTPSPWLIDKADNKIIVVGGTVTVCVVGYDLSGENNIVQADARLIAAAPELLEACKRALVTIEAMDPKVNEDRYELSAAIAKAEGQQ